MVHGLLSNHLVIAEDDLPAVKMFKETVSRELQRRFTTSSLDIAWSLPVCCAAVNPRYSQLCFLTEDQKATVHRELISQMELMPLMNNEAAEPPAKKKSKKDSAMHFLLGTSSSEQTTLTCKDELEYFLKEPTLDPDPNALEWWKKNQERFPSLSNIAKKLLCIPVTSVPSERIFQPQEGLLQNLGQALNQTM